MATTENVDLKRFIITLCESPRRWIHEATSGLTDDQLYFQPGPSSNSIAWLIWHLSRWRDKISAAAAGESEVWESQGWADRFGMEISRTGLGDTTEQVATFRVSRDLLIGYADSAHNAITDRVSRMSSNQFTSEIEYMPGAHRSAWRALISVMGDSSEHTGQINYLRGLITGPGWR